MHIAAPGPNQSRIGTAGGRIAFAPATLLYLGTALCLAIALLAGGDGAANPTACSSAASGLDDAGRARAAWVSASEAAAASDSEYALVADASGAILRAHDPATGLKTTFGADGVSISSASSVGAGWHLHLTTLGVGCVGTPAAVHYGGGPRIAAQSNRAAYRATAGGSDLDEWFTQGPLGLEQGFTLDESPCPDGEIEVDVGMKGLTPALRADERGVDLRDEAGVIQAHYTDLYAEDAAHETLPARLIVARGGVVLRVDVHGASFPITIDPLAWAAPQKISAGGQFASFGTSTAISGANMVIGAIGVNSETGAAYISTQQSSGPWAQPPSMLVASDGASTDEFGASVAIAGTIAVVGAPGANSSQGKAYVFAQQSTGTWTQQGGPLAAADGEAFDNFGEGVGIAASGAILIGSPNATATFMGLTMAGKVYVFTPEAGGAYTNTQTLTASDASSNSVFGSSVSVAGNEAIIGSPGGFDGFGEAYVFTDQPDGSWTPTGARLLASDGMAGDNFGSSVGISGSLVIVGAPSATVGNMGQQGKAYAFALSGGTWTQEGAALLANSTFLMFNFGTSVAISGTTAVVGAPGAQIPSFAVQGAAYVFTQSGAAFAQPATLSLAAPDGFVGDGFGRAVAISGSTVVIGGPSELFAGATQGAAYVAPVLLTVGSACSTNAQCSGGNCIAGSCCSSACAGPCTTCATGTCKTITSADDPVGCTGASTCSATGKCGLKNGQAASAASACASGDLADGVCCASACAGSCNACTAALGASANGTCGIARQGTPGSPRCVGYVCGGSVAACPLSCAADADCAVGFYCRADRTCQPEKAAGAACNLAAGSDCAATGCRACASAFCVDGVCCGTACSTCQACSTALQAPGGTNGACSAALSNTDPRPSCPMGSTCNGSGACGLKNGQLSTTANACASEHVADGVCCATACGAACDVCSVSLGASTDGTCTPAPQGTPGNPACGAGIACNGAIASCPAASCTSDSGCLAGFYCGATGTCQPQKAIGSACNLAAAAGGDCLQGDCRECANQTACVDGVCCGSVACPACRACSAQLQAPGGVNGTCSAALLGTAPHSDCPSTSTCNGAGACGLRNGQPSTSGGACATGQVADGVCCDQACTGECSACSKARGAIADGACATAVSGSSCDGGTCAGTVCVALDGGVEPDAEAEESGARDASVEASANVGDAGARDAAQDATGADSSPPTMMQDGSVSRDEAGPIEEDGGNGTAGEFAREHPSCSCRLAGGLQPMEPAAWGASALVVLIAARRRRGRSRAPRLVSGKPRWAALLVLVGISSAAPRTANAQPATDEQRGAARAAATEGYRAMGEQRWGDAVDRFTRAEELVHAPPHLLYLGRALVHLHRYVAAHETYVKLTREVLPPQAPVAAVNAQADGAKDLKALEPKMASLVVIVRPPSLPVTLTMDGAALPLAMIGIAIPADPGDHTLEAKAKGYLPATRSTSVSEGSQGTVTLDLLVDPNDHPSLAASPAALLEPSTAASSESGPPAHGSTALRVGGYGALVLAGAAVATGIVFAVNSQDKVTAGDKLCPGNTCPAPSTSALDSLNHDATLFGEISTAAFVLSGVAAAGGLTAIVLSHGSGSSPGAALPTAAFRIGPGQVNFAGTF